MHSTEKKLSIVYNFARLYREPIFQLIEQNWNCEWYFGKGSNDIKDMDVSKLQNYHYINRTILPGGFKIQKGISGLIRKKNVSKILILAELKYISTWLVLLQKRLFFPNKKVYLWTHGWYGNEGYWMKRIKKLFYGMADNVFTYGEYAKKIAISQGFNSKKISAIHNSLNHDFQLSIRSKLSSSKIYYDHFGNEHPVLLFIGRLTPVKKLDLLLHAVSNAKRNGHEYNVVFIGTGTKKIDLEVLTKDLRLENQVWFYGECYDDTQNAQLIYDADLCVAPGNVGLTAMHSMVFGTPVLTHNDFSYQMPEFEAILDGVTGCFFKRNNIDSLENSIHDWFYNHKDREQTRNLCFKEIDTKWTPQYSLNILKQYIK